MKTDYHYRLPEEPVYAMTVEEQLMWLERHGQPMLLKGDAGWFASLHIPKVIVGPTKSTAHGALWELMKRVHAARSS